MRLTATVFALASILLISTTTYAGRLSEQEKTLWWTVNSARQEKGLRKVRFDRRLVAIAQARSRSMARFRYFSHVSPFGKTSKTMLQRRGIPFRRYGEIIAWMSGPTGYSGDIYWVARAWMLSPQHRNILFDASFRRAGVGISETSDGRSYYTMVFVR